MVRLIMSGSGEGKTKQLLDLMNTAAETETGSLVCIEPTRNMSYNLRHQTRLVDASEFSIDSFETLRAFICGLYAGNYDISHIFIDNLYQVAHCSDEREVGDFLSWLDTFTSPLGMKAVITVSADPESATDVMKKYM
jgi:hypothetical protein